MAALMRRQPPVFGRQWSRLLVDRVALRSARRTRHEQCADVGRAVVSQRNLKAVVPLFALLSWVGCVDSDVIAPTVEPETVAIPDPLPLEVTGENFEWLVRYPGADGLLGTDDDLHTTRHLHAPEHTRVRITLRSSDYLYTFALPEQDVKEIAVPDLAFEVVVEAGDSRAYELKGDQFCGFSHPELSGQFIVESREQFAAWVQSLPRYH